MYSDTQYKVSVIIPCLNEEDYIAQCLDSVLANDYPNEDMEILICDGLSKDSTREIVGEYSKKFNNVRLLDNPNKLTPAALNVGIKNARGSIIVRLDAHTVYSADYISKSVELLEKSEAANVGGIIKTIPSKSTILAKSIALALSHFFGVGLSFFRIGSKRQRYTDTVPFGCFRRELFDEIGLFDEQRPRSEDVDFNERIRKSGKKILLSPQIISYYYSRGTLKKFFLHNFDNGRMVTIHIFNSRSNPHSWRHFIPVFCLLMALTFLLLSFFNHEYFYIIGGLVGLYLILDSYFSFKTAIRQKNPLYFFSMFFIFPFLHLSYAMGSVYGLFQGFTRSFLTRNSDQIVNPQK